MSTDDLTVAIPRGITAVAIFNGDEVLVLRDREANNGWEFTNPVAAAVMSARLRAWADFIDSMTIPAKWAAAR